VNGAVAWLRDVQPPFFAWIHLYDPHAPYDPPKEFLARAKGQPYDGEVAYADAEAGRIVDVLRQRGLYEDAVIVVAGDHGEGLGEHNERTHGMLAYDSTLRVPLILVAPDTDARGHVGDVVSLAGIAPSLLDLARVSVPEAMGRASLLSRREEGEAYAETEYPRTAGWHPIAALADARWKLLLSSEPELYDLEADPGETRNIATARPELVDAMSRRVRDLNRAREGSLPERIDPEAAARLRSLGYVSGTPAPAPANTPNPARVIHDWTTFERALEELNGGKTGQAIAALKNLAAKFPGSIVFQGTYARALMEGGNAAAAVEQYRALVKQQPNDAMLFHDLAVAARAAGQPDEALRAEQAALALDKDNPAALDGLGLLHADAGRAADAAAAFERAAQVDPRNPSHWNNLGNARRELGDLAGAESAYRRALTLDPDYPDALNGVGVLLVQRGAAAEAIPLLIRALARAPDFHEARLNLGIAYQEGGEVTKAAQVYRDLLARAPGSASRERAAAQKLLDSLR
jgi:tetratricopeptide (TPR) repeat protein